jgi:anti-sigma-K factor RskA
MHKNDRLGDHQKFKELSALAQGGMLSSNERQELEQHLQGCVSCQKIFDEYSLISTEGMPLLGAHYGNTQEYESWDDHSARHRLFARIRESERSGPELVKAKLPGMGGGFPSWEVAKYRTAAIGIAACLMIAMAAYHLGGRMHQGVRENPVVASLLPQELASQRKAAAELLDAQAAQISRLQKQVSSEQQELARLRAASRAADDYSSALSSANSKNQEQLRLVAEQRDKLASQVRDAEQAYQNVQLELSSLRAEHDRVLLRTASLESKIEELTTAAREQERKLRDNEQYLASDRDIRELMGARKLYIADVFDVDSRSRTRKPFGRVFYTQNKSLVFYAFDLDREAGVKSASAFQVWGQRDNEPGEKSRPTNLGILYMDSESNRRWVLRFDDPKQLAEIDAVFVTVEPHGGSQKPTGKPLLYALLRKEANHP